MSKRQSHRSWSRDRARAFTATAALLLVPRALAVLLALSTAAAEAVAQSFQFMPSMQRAPVPVLPSNVLHGNGIGGDLDGDDIEDIVMSSTSTRVLLRTATGWTSTTLPPSPGQPLLAHLDGDGQLDLLCAPARLPTSGPLTVFRNALGAMTPVALPIGNAAVQGVAVGDVDADGFGDLVLAAPSGSVTPSLVLLRGGPGLQFAVDFTATPMGLPLALWPVLLDSDGDGDLDVLASNATSGLRLLRNIGGTFVDATASLPSTRLGHEVLVGGDLDGDGCADCVAALQNGDIDVLWGGAGRFTFWAGVSTGPGVERLWPHDFDGDGDLDILIHGTASLDVLWNLGNRQFTRTSVSPVATNMRVVADIDRDGLPDVVFAAAGSTDVRCKYGARFEDAAVPIGIPTTPTGANQTPPVPADFDGDGRTDLVYVGTNTVAISRAAGGGVYRSSSAPVTLPGTSTLWECRAARMDGDADLDLVVATNSTLNVLLNAGDGSFTSTLQRPATTQGLNWIRDGLRVGDMDGDGDLDIVQAQNLGIQLTRNQGSGQFAAPVVLVPPLTIPGGTIPPHSVEVADFDGDGDLDVLGVSGAPLTGTLLRNNGNGTFVHGGGVDVGGAASMCAADFDGDGDLDLVSTQSFLRIFRNDGTGLFSERTDLPQLGELILSNLVAADLDDDGDVDVAAISGFAPVWVFLLNDGTGRFTDAAAARVQVTISPILAFSYLRAADIDDDGDADLIAGGSQPALLVNHLRQCSSRVAPRLGGAIDVGLYSGPGFGSPGLGLLGIGFALAAPPPSIAGLAGRLALDPATLQIFAAVATSPVGLSTALVQVPQDNSLFGLELWLQGAILPAVGHPGLTNAVYEVVLR